MPGLMCIPPLPFFLLRITSLTLNIIFAVGRNLVCAIWTRSLTTSKLRLEKSNKRMLPTLVIGTLLGFVLCTIDTTPSWDSRTFTGGKGKKFTRWQRGTETPNTYTILLKFDSIKTKLEQSRILRVTSILIKLALKIALLISFKIVGPQLPIFL